MNKPDYKIIQIYCDHCHHKQILTNEQLKELVEVKTSSVPTNIPKLDMNTQKTVLTNPMKQRRKFKCSKCGFVVVPRLVPDPQKNMEAQQEQLNKAQERKALEEEMINRDREARKQKNEKN